MGSSGQGRLTKALTSSSSGSSVSPGTSAAALQLENSRLREELDALKRRLPSLGLLRRTCSSVGGAGQGGAAASSAALEQLVAALAQVGPSVCCLAPVGCLFAVEHGWSHCHSVLHATLSVLQARSENERLRAAAAAQGLPLSAEGMPGPAGAVEAAGAVLRKQVKDFAQGAQLDLQRQLKAFEARAIMAEEQLSHLQASSCWVLCVWGGRWCCCSVATEAAP